MQGSPGIFFMILVYTVKLVAAFFVERPEWDKPPERTFNFDISKVFRSVGKLFVFVVYSFFFGDVRFLKGPVTGTHNMIYDFTAPYNFSALYVRAADIIG